MMLELKLLKLSLNAKKLSLSSTLYTTYESYEYKVEVARKADYLLGKVLS